MIRISRKNTWNLVTNDTQVLFTLLFGSYFGDWDSQNNFLRAQLATASATLASAWAGRPYWMPHHLGLGEPLGIRHLLEMQHLLAPLVEPKLQAQKGILEQAGFQVTVEIKPGLPQHEINRVAVAKDCSLIVVGTHGRTMSGEIHLGGVASEIIHNIRRPILLVRMTITTVQDRQQCEAICANMLDHVLFPTDFSDNAEHASKVVDELVRHGVKRVTLLHVQDKAMIGTHLEDRIAEFNEIDRGRLDRLKATLTRQGAADVRCELTYGSPVTGVPSKAREDQVR